MVQKCVTFTAFRQIDKFLCIHFLVCQVYKQAYTIWQVCACLRLLANIMNVDKDSEQHVVLSYKIPALYISMAIYSRV